VVDEGVKKSIEMTRLINEALGRKPGEEGPDAEEDLGEGREEQPEQERPSDGSAAEGRTGP